MEIKRFMSGLATVFFTFGICNNANANVLSSAPISFGFIVSSLSAASYYMGLNNYSDTDYISIVNVSFTEAVKHPISQYKPILDDTLDYDIYLDSSSLHWAVVVRADAPIGKFPYVTFEITQNNSWWSTIKGENSTLIPVMRIIHPEKEKDDLYQSSGIMCPTLKGASLVASMAGGGSIGQFMLRYAGCYLTKKGTVRTNMRELSEKAERIRQEKAIYNLYTYNCQDFANDLLKELGLPTTPTTFDKAKEIFDEMKKTYNEIQKKYVEIKRTFDEIQKAFDETFDESDVVCIFLMLLELEKEINKSYS